MAHRTAGSVVGQFIGEPRLILCREPVVPAAATREAQRAVRAKEMAPMARERGFADRAVLREAALVEDHRRTLLLAAPVTLKRATESPSPFLGSSVRRLRRMPDDAG